MNENKILFLSLKLPFRIEKDDCEKEFIRTI